MKQIVTICLDLVLSVAVAVSLLSCGGQDTPQDTRYLLDFHLHNFEQASPVLVKGRMSLYVDYSTCCAMGQNSQFFQDVSASLVNKATSYYAIRGAQITREDIASGGGVYTLLRNIEEVNYAELKTAADRMADGNEEAVLLTDGEYFTLNTALGHDNDPYLAQAFKKWILKGHDIHIISEPYAEPYNGQSYQKKRFYIMFTDDRMANNIYERVCQTVNFSRYDGIDEFHISASHPRLFGAGNNSSVQNEVLLSKVKGYGHVEIEDWDGCDWETIEEMLVCQTDSVTGEPLPIGVPIITMQIDRSSFGCYDIEQLGVRTTDINREYNDYYTAREAGEKPVRVTDQPAELQQFIVVDDKAFKRDGTISLSFAPDWFDPSQLTGNLYNYLKIDLYIAKLREAFSGHERQFEFESISQPGMKNVSVASSIKQCLADDDVKAKMSGQVIYTIYVKSEKK